MTLKIQGNLKFKAFGVFLMTALALSTASGQAEIREITSAQAIEREMTGAQTHHYKLDLKANEFFQVRVEPLLQ